RQLVVVSVRPAELDRYVLAFNEAAFAQAAAERSDEMRGILWRPGTHEPDDGHRRLPRACRKRPGRRAAEERDERAAFNAGHGDFLPCRVASARPGPTGRR